MPGHKARRKLPGHALDAHGDPVLMHEVIDCKVLALGLADEDVVEVVLLKIQLPLASNEPNPRALVYNQDRSMECLIPITEELLFDMNGSPKKFFLGIIHSDGHWGYANEVTDPGW